MLQYYVIKQKMCKNKKYASYDKRFLKTPCRGEINYMQIYLQNLKKKFVFKVN